MAYQLVTVPTARQALKKLPKLVRKHIVKSAQILVKSPRHGEQLEGQLKFLRSFHTVYRHTHYRIAYEIDDIKQELIIRLAASRENFYKKLRRLNLKPLS